MAEQEQFGVQPDRQSDARQEKLLIVEPDESEGLRRLRSIGLEGLADQEVTLPDGRKIVAGDFWDECGIHALPMFEAYDASVSDPLKYLLYRKALRGVVGKFLNMDLNKEQINEQS